MLRSASPRLSSVLASFVAALTVDGDAAARPQPHGFRVVGNRPIVLAEIKLRAAADEMGHRQIRIETNRLLSVGQGAIVLMAHGPEIGAIGVGVRKFRIDLDGLIEIGFRLGQAALDRAGETALRIGCGKGPAADSAGIDHLRATRDGFVRRALLARARRLVRNELSFC
jgi:hypothetical protein